MISKELNEGNNCRIVELSIPVKLLLIPVPLHAVQCVPFHVKPAQYNDDSDETVMLFEDGF